MTTSKKPRSKRLAKEAVTLDDLQAQLDRIRQQVAYCVVQLGYNDQEKPHPIVVEAIKSIDFFPEKS